MKSPKTKAPKPMKARKMWANQCECNGIVYAYPTRAYAYSQGSDEDPHRSVPVAVIPLDDVEALVGKAMQAYADCPTTAFKDAMQAALAAIGVLPKTRKGRK